MTFNQKEKWGGRSTRQGQDSKSVDGIEIQNPAAASAPEIYAGGTAVGNGKPGQGQRSSFPSELLHGAGIQSARRAQRL